MKVGSLVKLKFQIAHVSGTYQPGAIGIVVSVKDPTPKDPTAIATVMIGNNLVTCYWKELEILSSGSV